MTSVIDQIAAKLSGGVGGVPIARSERVEGALSFAQKRLWFLDQLTPESAEYVVPFGYQISGPVNLSALTKAFRKVVERHPVLRTACEIDAQGEPVQRVLEPWSVTIDEFDLTQVAVTDRDDRVREVVEDAFGMPFDLTAGQLLRVQWIHVGVEEGYLLFQIHHIAVDGWSAGIILADIEALYRGEITGNDVALSSAPVDYLDFAAWQQDLLSGELLERQLRFWCSALEGLEPVELPTDRSRPLVRSGLGGSVSFVVPSSVVESLKRLAQQRNASLFMVGLAAFEVLLARWSGQVDIAVGTPIAGRTQAELEDVVGFFVNTLVVRGDLESNPSFEDFVDQIRDAALGAYDHQDLPFDRVVEELSPERDLSRTPVFQHMFALNVGSEGDDLELEHATVGLMSAEAKSSKFDLTLTLTQVADVLEGKVVFASDLFDTQTMERLAGHFVNLLTEAGSNPKQRVGDIDFLTERERLQLTVGFNDTASKFDDQALVHEFVERHARKTPDAVALWFEDESMTYGQLNSRANQLAVFLRRSGVESESLVAVCLERGFDMVVSLLAIWKAGGAYVPIDPAYPAERVAFMIEDTAAQVVLTQSSLVGLFSGARTNSIVALDVVALDLEELPTRDLDRRGSPTDLAYVIYTSGSTGTPKGVMIEHQGICSLVASDSSVAGIQSSDVILAGANFVFDAAVYEFWGALTQGASMVIGSERMLLDGDAVRDLVKVRRVTQMFVTPILLAPLYRAGAFDALRAVVFGGEAADPALVRDMSLALPGCAFVNAYGPSEFSVMATVFEIGSGWSGGAVVPIGRPVANARAVVVDRWGGLAPVGVAGELLIGGAGVGRGYLNRPDLTAERFVDDPVVRGAGRVYRTGDLVRWLPGGSLEFLGRQDNQVKIRGLRIELGEIESQLMKSPTVSAGAVVVKDDGAGGKRLVAYCVSSSESVSELRDWCAQKLPAFMVPNVFVFLDALPMTPSGKLDRRALPEPVASRDSLEGEYVAPRNEVERALAEIWAEVLGVDRVGVHDNFFAIGGHSLLATKAVSRANQLLDMSASVKNLFVTPTIAGYAHGTLSGGVGGVPIARSERVEGALSFAQKRLWFLDQLTPESAEYVVPFGYQISGPVNLSALTKAFRKVVERHPVLRTACEIDAQGEPVQRVLEPWSVTIDEFDLTQVAVTDRDDRVREVVEDAFGMPFDLTAGQLLRVQWIHVGVEEGYLLFQIHHIAVDGWSAGIILADIEALYRGEITGNDVALSSAPVDYLDFAAWQQDLLSGELLERQLRFWCSALEGLEPVELPTDRSRPLVRSGLGGSVSFVVPSSVVESLKRLAQQRNASLFMVGLAAFEVLLARWSGQVDIAVGTPIAGRTQAELEDVVGFFVNTLVVRGDLESNPSFEDFVDQIRDAALGAYDHQDLPFDRVVEELSPERDLSRTPVFQHMFALNVGSEGDDLELEHATVGLMSAEAKSSKFDLTLTLTQVADVLEGKVVFASDLFDTQTMERLAGHFVNLLTEAGSNPKQRVGDIDFLTERERLQLTVGFNDTASKFDDQALVHEFVERHARKTPDAVALWFEDESMTYGQLNSRANQLAVFLRRSGVESESLVAVCLERGFDMVVSLLAIWKAGGAYVPIDPAYPAERVAFMIEDTAAQVVLTQSSLVGLFSGARTNSIVALDVVALDLEELPTRDLDRRGSPTDLAYVIYTSGSTGTPKGVMIEHQGICSLVASDSSVAGIQSSDVILAGANFAFDAIVFELWAPLVSGAQSVIVDSTVMLNHGELESLILRRGVSVAFITTALLAQLVQMRSTAFSTLRCLLYGGERSDGSLVLGLREIDDGPKELRHVYGPTETTVFATQYLVPVQHGAVVPIGRPVANARAVVVDRWGGLAPVGVAGELLIGGAGVGRGYLNRPDLTAERFVDDPVVRGAGRVYRTGDLVRWLPGGSLEFLGRQDNQVKIRGLRIELGEIESQLMKSPTVSAGAVVVKDDGAGGKRLVAYCVSSSESVSELRDWCAQKLPAFMVPNVFVFLDALPMTPSGKLDRRALPEPVASRDSLEGEYVAPRNEVERALAEIWAEVLGVDRVGVHDNFFAIGGHSLLATKAVSRAKQRGVDVSLGALMVRSTISGVLAVEANSSRIIDLLTRTNPSLGRPALVCIHPSGGSSHWFKDIATQLEGTLDVYGVRARGMLEGEPYRDSIAGLAADYIHEIECLLNGRKVILLGWSLGATIAHHMAFINAGLFRDIILLEPASVSSHENSRFEHYASAYEEAAQIVAQRGLSLSSAKRLRELSADLEVPSEMVGTGEWLPFGALGGLVKAVASHVPSIVQSKGNLITSEDLGLGTSTVTDFELYDYVDWWGQRFAETVIHQQVAASHLDMVTDPRAIEVIISVILAITEEA
ncbi:hypothetical protein NYA9BBAC_02593 [Salinibacterium sp. NYA9b]